jgi:hypothetical protein
MHSSDAKNPNKEAKISITDNSGFHTVEDPPNRWRIKGGLCRILPELSNVYISVYIAFSLDLCRNHPTKGHSRQLGDFPWWGGNLVHISSENTMQGIG